MSSKRSVALAAAVLVVALAGGLAGEVGAAAARTSGLPAADPASALPAANPLDDRKHAVDDQIAKLHDPDPYCARIAGRPGNFRFNWTP